MMITHKLEMDLLERGDLQRIDAVQGDRNTRQLELTLYSGGEPWNIPEGISAVMRYCKSDGTKGYYDTLPDGRTAWTAEGNVLTVELAPQMLTAEGIVLAQVEMLAGQRALATFGFQIRVEVNPAAGALGSEDYFNWLQWMEQQLDVHLEEAKESGDFVSPVEYEWDGTRLVMTSAKGIFSADLQGPRGARGLRGETGKASPVLYTDKAYTLYDLPRESQSERYKIGDSGALEVLDTLGAFSELVRCPRYLGWRLEEGSAMYLYIGDMVDGVFQPDGDYQFSVYGTKKLFNYLQPEQNRIIEITGEKYFRYRISEDQGVTILGMEHLPAGEQECLAIVPNHFTQEGEMAVAGNFYGIVLPNDCYYAVFTEGASDPAQMNVCYEYESVSEEDGAAQRKIHITKGACFGYIPAEAGAAVLTVPDTCPPESLHICTSKGVKAGNSGGRGRRAMKLAKTLTRDFRFVPAKSTLWSGSGNRHLEEGRQFYGVPYSSRWRNGHFVGYEVSAKTAMGALKDKFSIGYEGCKYVENGTEKVWGDAKRSEGGSRGGPGYGLVCSSMACMLCGNPYPQTNRGFTLDRSFHIMPVTHIQPGMVLVRKDLKHCVTVGEIYGEGYSLVEATAPCAAETLHTNQIEEPGYLEQKTRLDMLEEYPFAVANMDTGGYGKLMDLEDTEVPEAPVRPWRGHRAVYGKWDKSCGNGVGITVQENAPARNGVVTVRLHVPVGKTEDGAELHEIRELEIAEGTRYVDLAKFEENGEKKDKVTGQGTYRLECVGSDIVDEFRYFEYGPVTLYFDENAAARFRMADGSEAGRIEYAYVKVRGFGGDYGRFGTDAEGPMVIGAGSRYPELAAEPERILEVYAAMAADDTKDGCWGRFSCECSLGGV